ncbi:MAG TPA: ECF transporter S component [Atribacteraceae bacterium]|nr:ECF transporter S component [Atribacteraceae bacterium]
MNRIDIIVLVTGALGVAVVFAATLVLFRFRYSPCSFPPAREAARYAVAICFGPLAGALAGGIGSFFADHAIRDL